MDTIDDVHYFVNPQSRWLRLLGRPAQDIIRSSVEPDGHVYVTRSPDDIYSILSEMPPPLNGGRRLFGIASGDGGSSELFTALDELVEYDYFTHLTGTGTIRFMKKFILEKSRELSDHTHPFNPWASDIGEVMDYFRRSEPPKTFWFPLMKLSSNLDAPDNSEEKEYTRLVSVYGDGVITRFLSEYYRRGHDSFFGPGPFTALQIIARGAAGQALEHLSRGIFEDHYSPYFLEPRRTSLTLDGETHIGDYNIVLATSFPFTMDLKLFKMSPCWQLPPLSRPYDKMQVVFGNASLENFLRYLPDIARGKRLDIEGIEFRTCSELKIETFDHHEQDRMYIADGEVKPRGSSVTLKTGYGVDTVLRTFKNRYLENV